MSLLNAKVGCAFFKTRFLTQKAKTNGHTIVPKNLGQGGPAIRQYWSLAENFLRKQPDIILVYTSGPAAGRFAYATRWVSTSCFSKLTK